MAPAFLRPQTLADLGRKAIAALGCAVGLLAAGAAMGMGVGNLVFEDDNGNGHYDVGEGVGGVRVELWIQPSSPEASPTRAAFVDTQPDGTYWFTGLPAGTYRVMIPASQFQPGGPLAGRLSLPGAQLVGDDDTGEDGLDVFDPTVTGVETISFLVSVGYGPSGAAESGYHGADDDADDTDSDMTVDFGFYVPLGIGNTVFADMNGDGAAQANEVIPNVVVQLFHASDDPSVDTPLNDTVTDLDGHFLFGGLLPGNYKLHVPASQFGPGGPLEGATSMSGTGAPGDDDNSTGSGHLGDNGEDDAAPQIHGISSGIVTLAAGTAPTGADTETGLASSDDDDADDNVNLTVDFGFVFPANKCGVGNLVFIDANGNGYYDEGEGVEGVKVMLFAQGQNPQTDIPAGGSRTTSSDGSYFFGSVTPGVYFLHVPSSEFAVGKALFSGLSVPNFTSGDDNSGEDGVDVLYPEMSGVSTNPFTLAVGSTPTDAGSEQGFNAYTDNFRDNRVDLTRDFGFVLRAVNPLSIGNLVFRDTNNNGKLDNGETGISGVTVQLYHPGQTPGSDAPLAQMQTQSNGTYMFSNLTPGNYFVHVPASQFATGAPLDGLLSSTGNGGDTNDDDLTDENGIDSATPATTGISSSTISLQENTEPVETGFAASMDNADDNNGDLTVDFGFTTDCALLTISPETLPQATKYASYSQTFTLTGGSGPVLWIKMSGSLPPGMTFSNAGVLSGTPTDLGFYDFTVKATLTNGCFAAQTFSLEVLPANNLGVGNTVFMDANGNGHFDPGEGVASVALRLFHDGEDPQVATPITTTTTDSEGRYAFFSLPPGFYFVNVPPTEFQSGRPLFHRVSMVGHGKDNGVDDDAGEDGIDDSLPDLHGISSIAFELAEGGEPAAVDGETGNDSSVDDSADSNFDLTIDLGFIPSPEVSVGLGNLVFRDANSNGFYDDGEGVDNVEVQLFHGADDVSAVPPIRSTTTLLGGRYAFMGLAPGSYKVFIPANQFVTGAPLYGCISLPGNNTPGNDKDDNADENGLDSATPTSTGIESTVVTLALGTAPVTASGNETGADSTSDDTADSNTNLNVDLGFVLDCHPITVLPATLVNAQMGTGMNFELSATGGVAPYSFIFAYGVLPDGVSISSEGIISGVPSNYGTFEFAVQVNDDYGCFSLKTYTLTVQAPPLAVGNLIFFDKNGNGHADAGEGVDNVLVQIYTNTQTPGTDTPISSATTSGGGFWLVDNLSPGAYVVHVPAAMFASGAPLWKMVSIPGVLGSGDDDQGEDGQDAINPASTGVTSQSFGLEPGLAPTDIAESGLGGSSDDARDGDIDLTRDLGFVDLSALPASFTAWQTAHPGAGGPGSNDDGDAFGNLLEYAFNTDPSSGVQNNGAVFAMTENQANGQFSVIVRRRHGGSADLNITLQVLSSLGQSPAAWTNSTLVPTIVNNGDGTETLTFGPVENDPAFSGLQQGFVRVHAELDANHDNTPETTENSFVLGWQKRSLAVRNQTYAVPYVPQALFTGGISGVNGLALDVSGAIGSGSISSLFQTGYEYYVEVISGDNEGHRIEVDKANSTASTIALLPSHDRSTLSTLPVSLAGDVIALRPHWRVVDLFPPSDFHGTLNAQTADSLIFWNNVTGTYTTLWLAAVPNNPQWLKAGTTTNMNAMVVAPCDGLFTKPRSVPVNAAATGQVRTWKFACPLRAGNNLVGSPYPMALSFIDKGMSTTTGFKGGTSPSTADRVLFWNGDAGTLSSYDTYYLLKAGAIERWAKSGGTADQSAAKLFAPNTAAYIISQLGNAGWVMPAPWTP